MSSFWWNFHHWLHWKLSKWQLPVQPVMKISSKWRHFRFSATVDFPHKGRTSNGSYSEHLCFLCCQTEQIDERTVMEVFIWKLKTLDIPRPNITQFCRKTGKLCSGYAWWRHQMETFSASLNLCEGKPAVTGGFPTQRPVTRSFDVFFDLSLKKQLSKQARRRSLETPSRSLRCRPTSSHYMSQYRPRSMSRWCITGPQCVECSRI